jgi:hypothetical protein
MVNPFVLKKSVYRKVTRGFKGKNPKKIVIVVAPYGQS